MWVAKFRVWCDTHNIKYHQLEDFGDYIRVMGNENISTPKLRLGNLEAKRDWGHAKDYVKAMWLMLQEDKPDDYVIATGSTHSVEDFIIAAFSQIGVYDIKPFIVQDPEFMRPAEVDFLLGDASKAFSKLGWEPEIEMWDMAGMMVENDIRQANDRKKL